MVVGFALAALSAGARALRVESARYVEAVRAVTSAPIIGLVKRDLLDSPVRITPLAEDVAALSAAGADIIAFDATNRSRPVSVADLVGAIRRTGCIAMADCSSVEDARSALALGVDCVGSTLSGYVGTDEPVEPDLALVRSLSKLAPFVIAEGRIRAPEQAALAVEAGASAVVVGSAITRTEHVTTWFCEAVDAAFAKRAADNSSVLSLDIGGSKSLVALIRNGTVVEEARIPTDRAGGPDAWLEAIGKKVQSFSGRYSCVGAAVTGAVTNGRWSALSRGTLDFPPGYPLVARLKHLTGKPVVALNDAQAAAWGEYKAREGNCRDLVFLTISTGVGGGVVVNGALLGGIAGHFGLTRGVRDPSMVLEDEVSGRWMAQEARRRGHEVDTPAIFAAAGDGSHWAGEIIDISARGIATLCRDLHLMFDPERIVIGGGVGLAEGYIDRVRSAVAGLAPGSERLIEAARLGALAGAIGAADIATSELSARDPGAALDASYVHEFITRETNEDGSYA